MKPPLLAARRNKKSIGMAEFQEAIERVQLGPERKSRVITPEEREIIAYHEAGHALVSHHLPAALPLRKDHHRAARHGVGLTWYLEDDNLLAQQEPVVLAQIASRWAAAWPKRLSLAKSRLWRQQRFAARDANRPDDGDAVWA
jgi:ATP-dependent Zn protease